MKETSEFAEYVANSWRDQILAIPEPNRISPLVRLSPMISAERSTAWRDL
jgi:hypothetical protein